MKKLNKTIAIGVDWSISEPEFDYLYGKYWEQICIIWLAQNIDISSFSFGWKNKHSMVFVNLLRYGVSNIAKVVRNKFKFIQIMHWEIIKDNYYNLKLNI